MAFPIKKIKSDFRNPKTFEKRYIFVSEKFKTDNYIYIFYELELSEFTR